MTKRLFGAIVVCGAFTAIGGSAAHAQMSTSNCIAMGPNMVHCDTLDMTPPASAPPTYPSQDGQVILGKAVRNLIFGDREKAFRMKVGKMIADGDCQGAARLALESGELELGQSIMAGCAP